MPHCSSFLGQFSRDSEEGTEDSAGGWQPRARTGTKRILRDPPSLHCFRPPPGGTPSGVTIQRALRPESYPPGGTTLIGGAPFSHPPSPFWWASACPQRAEMSSKYSTLAGQSLGCPQAAVAGWGSLVPGVSVRKLRAAAQGGCHLNCSRAHYDLHLPDFSCLGGSELRIGAGKRDASYWVGLPKPQQRVRAVGSTPWS